jgi:hypothetical protein
LLKDWNFVPDSKNYQLEISNNNDFSHSGTHSLRLMADFENAAVNPNTEYGGVGINKNFNSVDMIVAWVYIPKSEQVQGTKFKSHILVYVNGKDNQTIFTGQDRDVEPGMWTPLILGRTTSVEEDGLTQYQWNGTVDSLFISVWGNQHYKGSIYFDDITIYKEKDL